MQSYFVHKCNYSSFYAFVRKSTIQLSTSCVIKSWRNAEWHNLNKNRVIWVNYWWINMASSKWMSKLFMDNTRLWVCDRVFSIADLSNLMSCFKSHFKRLQPSFSSLLFCTHTPAFCVWAFDIWLTHSRQWRLSFDAPATTHKLLMLTNTCAHTPSPELSLSDPLNHQVTRMFYPNTHAHTHIWLTFLTHNQLSGIDLWALTF